MRRRNKLDLLSFRSLSDGGANALPSEGPRSGHATPPSKAASDTVAGLTRRGRVRWGNSDGRDGRDDTRPTRSRQRTPGTIRSPLAESPIDDDLLDWPPDVYALTRRSSSALRAIASRSRLHPARNGRLMSHSTLTTARHTRRAGAHPVREGSMRGRRRPD